MPIIVLNWITVAVVQFNPTSSVLETIARLAMAGTLFGITTLAAAWTAFGPLPFAWRLPLSILWVAARAPAIAINGTLYRAPRGEFVLVGIALLSQWLLLQFPLWGMAIGFGAHLVHVGDSAPQAGKTQFGIRQLMIATAIVSALFAVGRLFVWYLFGQEDYLRASVSGLVFLIFSDVVLTLPLVVAALLRRNTLAGIAIFAGDLRTGHGLRGPFDAHCESWQRSRHGKNHRLQHWHARRYVGPLVGRPPQRLQPRQNAASQRPIGHVLLTAVIWVRTEGRSLIEGGESDALLRRPVVCEPGGRSLSAVGVLATGHAHWRPMGLVLGRRGSPSSPPGVGFHKGVRLNLKAIIP